MIMNYSFHKVFFRVPNAKVGQVYQGVFKVQGLEAGQSARLRNLLLPPELGLVFDEAQQSLLGTPLVAGEYELALEWSSDDKVWQDGKCPLIVIADPRSLWKVLEPPFDAPYPKPHSAAQQLAGGQLLAASRRGRSHEHAGSFRDDDFFLAQDAQDSQDSQELVSGWSVLLVADGAGSAQCSREGARLAVQMAGEYLRQKLAPSGALDQELTRLLADSDLADSDLASRNAALEPIFQTLFADAAKCALDAIEQEAQANQRVVRDFATTLLAACVKQQGAQTWVASFWIGDGAIAAYGPRGNVVLMGTPDSGEYAGQTRFLDRACLAAGPNPANSASNPPAFTSRVAIACLTDLSAVFLMTDGVSDPRFETDKGLQDGSKWDALWDDLAPLLAQQAQQQAQQSLLEWLHFFTPGHHDDRTLAIWRSAAAMGGAAA